MDFAPEVRTFDSMRWTLLFPNFYATHRGLRELV